MYCQHCGQQLHQESDHLEHATKTQRVSWRRRLLTPTNILVVLLLPFAALYVNDAIVNYLNSRQAAVTPPVATPPPIPRPYSTTSFEAYPTPSSDEKGFGADLYEQVVPDPVTGVDIDSLPQGRSGTDAYYTGYEESQQFIVTGAITRAQYERFGGTTQSCKFILDSFMAYNGGSSTRQQYADFLEGCRVALGTWR